VNKGKKSGVIYNISLEESLAMDLRSLDWQLAKKDHDIVEIPRIQNTLSTLVLDLHYLHIANLYPLPSLQELNRKEEKYQSLLDRKNRRIALLRLLDYEQLLQIRDAIEIDSHSEHGLGFKFKESYKYVRSTTAWLPVSDKQKVEKERTMYLEHVTRVYGLVKELSGSRLQKLRKQFLEWDELLGSNTVSYALQWLWRLISGAIGFLVAQLPPFHF
ncbi:MAG: hypothetical protein WA021_05490, partial [Minisyncoccia bacterium]